MRVSDGARLRKSWNRVASSASVPDDGVQISYSRAQTNGQSSPAHTNPDGSFSYPTSYQDTSQAIQMSQQLQDNMLLNAISGDQTNGVHDDSLERMQSEALRRQMMAAQQWKKTEKSVLGAQSLMQNHDATYDDVQKAVQWMATHGGAPKPNAGAAAATAAATADAGAAATSSSTQPHKPTQAQVQPPNQAQVQPPRAPPATSYSNEQDSDHESESATAIMKQLNAAGGGASPKSVPAKSATANTGAAVKSSAPTPTPTPTPTASKKTVTGSAQKNQSPLDRLEKELAAAEAIKPDPSR